MLTIAEVGSYFTFMGRASRPHLDVFTSGVRVPSLWLVGWLRSVHALDDDGNAYLATLEKGVCVVRTISLAVGCYHAHAVV